MRIERITTPSEWASLHKEWDECLSFSGRGTVFLTFDWFFSWWECFGGQYNLNILLFRDSKGKLDGIAPLMLKGGETCFIASREVTDYCDLITRKGREERIINAFLFEISKNPETSDSLRLINIPEKSPSLPHLIRAAKELHKSFEVRETEVTLGLDLPGSYPFFIAGLSRKNRHELRRKVRKTEILPDLDVKSVSDPGEILTLLDTFIGLHRKGSPSKAGFWEQKGMAEFFRKVTFRLSKRGWVELNLLSIDSQPAAVLLNFLYMGEVLFYNIAYDPRFAAYSPGIFLFNHSIRRAIGLGKRRVDFLRGREKYKYNFGAEEYKIKDFIVTLREDLR